ncbi:MAG TPA: glycosyltransferase family 1 protein, partial [Leptospiraceae bacterium]|nr:glycosyltransferase family 1 protein [Leptospiraceae bacterium]
EIIPYDAGIYSIRELFGHPMMKKMDLLDIPHFNIAVPYLKKSIVTVHDLTPYIMKEFFPSRLKRSYLNLIFRLIKKSASVIAVSENTRQDLIREFKYNPNAVRVNYNAVDADVFRVHTKEETEFFRKKYSLPDKFYLTVGIGKEHKNFKFLLSCLLELWKEKREAPPLVLAGTGGKLPDYLQELALSADDGKLILFPRIKYEELPFLYSAADLMIFPSLYEGFGFPAVEAQASGCTVLSSNASVMPEILSDSAVYFDPKDRSSFLHSLNEIENNPEQKKILKERGFENIKRFDWKKSAREILSLYKEIKL